MPSLQDNLNPTTLISLLSTVLILGTAYVLSNRLLPAKATTRTRILFIWHAFDALIHFCLEGGFLYNCFFSYASVANTLWKDPALAVKGTPYLPAGVHFLGHADRVYGSAYGTNPLAALWREYARADARWEGTDLTIICLEILTVLVAGPLAVWICACLVQDRRDAWFWMMVVAKIGRAHV